MQRAPDRSDQIFKVSIYNHEVRSLVQENQRHAVYDDQWAEEQVKDVFANTEDEARDVVYKRFPPDDGFVIAKVKAVIAH